MPSALVIAVDTDTKKAQSELNGLSKKINNLNDQIEGKNRKRSYLIEQAEQIKAAYDSAVSAGQDDLAQSLAKDYDKVQTSIARVDGQIRDLNDKLSVTQNRAGDLADSLSRAGNQGSSALDSVNDRIGKFENRIIGLAKRVFVFSLISSALRGLRSWLMNAVVSNDQAAAAIARLKGALLTLAQPILQVVIPAFIALVNILTSVVNAIASAIAALFGTTATAAAGAAKSLNAESKAIGGVGKAAKKETRSLAAFDEINQLADDSDAGGGGGGGGASGSDIMPDFSGITDEVTPRLKEILGYVTLIAAGFALWKIAGNLPGILGLIAGKIGGLLIALGGLMLLWDGLQNAWKNGVGWKNLIEIFAGLAAAAIGLKIAFGAVAAGIALVVGGIAMIITGFHDAMENGWNLQNTLLTIGGILATGLGFFFITGSVIPLVIAGIAALLLAFTIATGHGEELINGIKQFLEGFVQFFKSVFAGDIEGALNGIEKMFGGLKDAVFAVISGLKDAIFSFLDWLDEKTNGKLHGIIVAVKEFLSGQFENIKNTIGGVIDGIMQILSGLTEFVMGVFTGDWETAWNGVKNIFKGVWNAVVSLMEGAINAIIKGMNWLISQMNKISFTAPDWVPGVGGKTVGINIPNISEVRIPRLAQGAVIPPNREFLAVLGDQSSGQNVEAPEGLIRDIVRGEMQQFAAPLAQIVSLMQQGRVLAVDGVAFADLSYGANNAKRSQYGSSLINVRGG